MLRKQLTCLSLCGALACGSGGNGPRSDAAPSNNAISTADSESSCSLPAQRTTIRARNGAILETWKLSLGDVLTSRLPDEPAFLDYRAAIERDSADVRRPVSDPPVVADDAAAAIWRDEFFNSDLVFEEGVGSVDRISCLDALLFARQADRVLQIDQPTEFLASVLRKDTESGTDLFVIFAAGSEMFVPRGWYGFDLIPDLLEKGWSYWYVIHNHTVQRNGDRLALGVPAPSTSDVKLLRNVARELPLKSVRMTNGFYTFSASVDELARFRAR